MIKFKKTIIIIASTILLMILLLFLNNNYKWIDSKNATILMQEELDHIRSMDISKLPEESKNFSAVITFYDHLIERSISAEVRIYHPKIPMNRVIVSIFLGDPILNYINTPNPLVSNIIPVKNASGIEKENYNLRPNGEVKGITVSSNMHYFETATFNDVLEATPYVIVKVSWLDENSNEKVEYVKYTRDKYIIIRR
ncbi:MAG: hypothetical protein IMW85_08815 [Thermicanus sp.]|nr:hypothetical protein [Thermicanus sp.]